MASPFRVFRKYQKTVLVVAGVILMFVFVIGDALVGYLGGSRGRSGNSPRDANAVAVRWDGGSVTNAELENLVVRRRITNAFLEQVEGLGAQAAYLAGVPPRDLRVQILRGPETAEQGVEQSVVQSRLFADAARKAGMHVSDDTVVQYLDDLGRRNVSRDDMRAIVARLHEGRVPIDYVIDALREEMLARNYITSHEFALETVTPDERWQDWLTVNDRVVVEAAAIPVEQFVVDAGEPSAAELEALFDKFKKNEPGPVRVGNVELPSSAPGFAVPRKIDLQYIEAKYEDLLAKVEEEVTEEEIQKYYDDNKDLLFIKADTGLIEEDANKTEDAEKSDEPAAEGTGGETTSETSPADTPAEGSETDAPVEPDASAESGDAPPGDPASDASPPTDGGDNKTAPAQADQSLRHVGPNNRMFRLAAFLQKSEGAETDVAKATEATDASKDAETAETTNATEERAAGSDTETGAEDPAEPPSAASGATEQPAGSSPAASKKPKEFQPLDEVRDVIRRELAQRKAGDRMTELMSRLSRQVNSEFQSYFGQVLDAQDKEVDSPPPPAALADLAPLAKEHGLAQGKTGPMSFLELRETPVGKSGSIETGTTLLQTLFLSDDLELYQPILTLDIDRNHYLAMKTSDTPRRIPELAEVKDDVVRAWKHERAAEAARKYAEDFAKKAQDARSPLTDFFADDQSVKVVRSDPFSLLTGGDVARVGGQNRQYPFRLSQPDEIEAAGPEFLQRVFELKDGEVAAVLNNDHSLAYVVRVVEHQDSPDELRSAYLAEANTWDGYNLKTSEHASNYVSHLRSEIIPGAKLDWLRDPDQIKQRREDEEG